MLPNIAFFQEADLPDGNASVHSILRKVEAAHGARIHASPFAFCLADELHSSDLGSAGHGAGREDASKRIESGLACSQLARNLTGQVHDVAELFDLHQGVDLDAGRLAHAVHVVARQIDQHDVLCAILLRRAQLSAKLSILCYA